MWGGKIIKLFAVFTVIIIPIMAVTVYGYYVLDQTHSELLQDIQNIDNELETTWNQLNDSHTQLSNSQTELEQYETKLEENTSQLQSLRAGDEYHLHDPTYNESLEFINDDVSIDEASSIEKAKKQGIRCAYVYVKIYYSENDYGAFTLIGFNTIDEAMVHLDVMEEKHEELWAEYNRRHKGELRADGKLVGDD